MEADQATSHVEFFAKACTAILEVWNRAVQGLLNWERFTAAFP